MADLSQHDKPSDDAFSLHEAYVVWEIAWQEAIAMQHNPGFVHLAGASLYRLRDSDLSLAKELGVTVYHIRDWAMKNLPTTNPFGRSYEGHIDFDYTVERRLDKMHVGKVRKPAKAAPTPYPEHVHPPGGGKLIMVERNDPAASELWATAMKSSLRFAQEIFAGSQPDEPPATTARRIFLSSLSNPEVQSLLHDIGYSVDELRTKLGGPFGR
ncbi:MAG: hypothetical protein IID01_12485 [Chloroflexi bacterium]|nr:hypothetical protein [Chloroflexota bacterium]